MKVREQPYRAYLLQEEHSKNSHCCIQPMHVRIVFKFWVDSILGEQFALGGMVGTIITVKDDSVTLRTGESKIEVVRNSVERVITEDE